jgi:hypothetical protein
MGQLTIHMPPIYLGTPPPPGDRPRYWLAKDNNVLSVSLPKSNTRVDVTLAGNNQDCAFTFGRQFVCTITLDIPVGRNQPLTLVTRYGPKASLVLARATQEVSVVAGSPAVITPSFIAIAHGLAVRSSTAAFLQGSPLTTILTVYGVDGRGALIPSERVADPSGHPITGITLSGSGAYARASITDNGGRRPAFHGAAYTSAVFAYNGKLAGAETISATPHGELLRPATADLTFRPSTTLPAAQIFADVKPSPSGPRVVLQFSSAASGNVAPLRTVSTPLLPVGADGAGGFWAVPAAIDGPIVRMNAVGDVVVSIAHKMFQYFGAAALDATGNAFYAPASYQDGSSNCYSGDLTVLEYGARSDGTRLADSIPLDWDCGAEELSVDALGDLYVGEFMYEQDEYRGHIVELGPKKADGTRNVIRTIDQTQEYGSSEHRVTLAPLAGDPQGNLFEMRLDGKPGLIEYPAGSKKPQIVLAGVTISAFALDGKGDIYAEVPASSTTCAIQEFAPGSSVAMRTIAGPATGLGVPVGIAVAQ